jgi:hypothetical protein
MIMVKASAGLVMELSIGASGRFDTLSLRLSEGLAAKPFTFEVSQDETGRLLVKPTDSRPVAELVIALGAIAANEENILAEVRKYSYVGR